MHMRAKDVIKVLGCSPATLSRYVKQGKLKLVKVLDNGKFDYDESSVYDMLSNSYLPKTKRDFIVVIDHLGNKHEFYVDSLTSKKVVEYLNELTRFDEDEENS